MNFHSLHNVSCLICIGFIRLSFCLMNKKDRFLGFRIFEEFCWRFVIFCELLTRYRMNSAIVKPILYGCYYVGFGEVQVIKTWILSGILSNLNSSLAFPLNKDRSFIKPSRIIQNVNNKFDCWIEDDHLAIKCVRILKDHLTVSAKLNFSN